MRFSRFCASNFVSFWHNSFELIVNCWRKLYIIFHVFNRNYVFVMSEHDIKGARLMKLNHIRIQKLYGKINMKILLLIGFISTTEAAVDALLAFPGNSFQMITIEHQTRVGLDKILVRTISIIVNFQEKVPNRLMDMNFQRPSKIFTL